MTPDQYHVGRSKDEILKKAVAPLRVKIPVRIVHPVNNYYANANICDISKSIETMTMRLQQHRIYRILGIFSNFGVT